MSVRDVEDLLAQRGMTVSYEAIRLWCLTVGSVYARRLTRRQGRLGDIWHLDEVFVTIQGQRRYLWVTDKLSSDRAAHRAVMPSVAHRTDRYENNRAEVSHQPTRQRERQIRRCDVTDLVGQSPS